MPFSLFFLLIADLVCYWNLEEAAWITAPNIPSEGGNDGCCGWTPWKGKIALRDTDSSLWQIITHRWTKGVWTKDTEWDQKAAYFEEMSMFFKDRCFAKVKKR